MSGGVQATDLVPNACACGHAVWWHHDTRGCGYRGFAKEHRCDCLLMAHEAVEGVVAAARADERERIAPLVRRAILNPGAFVKRDPDYEGEPYGERLDQWQDRAIRAALGDEA